MIKAKQQHQHQTQRKQKLARMDVQRHHHRGHNLSDKFVWTNHVHALTIEFQYQRAKVQQVKILRSYFFILSYFFINSIELTY